METNINRSENAMRDEKLVIAACSGDDTAFSQLMNLYKDAIHFMLLKMVNYKIDVDDLVIESFAKAFTNIHQYNNQFAFSTWLYNIAVNQAIDHMRKKRVITVPLESTPETDGWIGIGYDITLKASADNPEEALIRKQNAVLLRKSVACLKPKYRKILEMHYFNEYSYIEIAEKLKLPLDTVKVQLYRSRELLIEHLKSNEIRRMDIS